MDPQDCLISQLLPDHDYRQENDMPATIRQDQQIYQDSTKMTGMLWSNKHKVRTHIHHLALLFLPEIVTVQFLEVDHY